MVYSYRMGRLFQIGCRVAAFGQYWPVLLLHIPDCMHILELEVGFDIVRVPETGQGHHSALAPPATEIRKCAGYTYSAVS